MLGVIAAAYLLLALRVRVLAQAALCGAWGSVALEIGAAGIALRMDGLLRMDGARLSVAARHGAKTRKREATPRQKALQRTVRRLLVRALRRDETAQLFLHARVGLGDADKTALAAGALRAAVKTACAVADLPPAAISIVPDYGGVQMCAQARCIFFFQPGDIMLAVVRERFAARKTGKEGLEWKSIPLRA